MQSRRSKPSQLTGSTVPIQPRRSKPSQLTGSTVPSPRPRGEGQEEGSWWQLLSARGGPAALRGEEGPSLPPRRASRRCAPGPLSALATSRRREVRASTRLQRSPSSPLRSAPARSEGRPQRTGVACSKSATMGPGRSSRTPGAVFGRRGGIHRPPHPACADAADLSPEDPRGERWMPEGAGADRGRSQWQRAVAERRRGKGVLLSRVEARTSRLREVASADRGPGAQRREARRGEGGAPFPLRSAAAIPRAQRPLLTAPANRTPLSLTLPPQTGGGGWTGEGTGGGTGGRGGGISGGGWR